MNYPELPPKKRKPLSAEKKKEYKRRRMIGVPDLPRPDDPMASSDEEEQQIPDTTPSRLQRYRKPNKSVCAYYRNKLKRSGQWIFHKRWLHDAMHAYKDSPDYLDLKNKRFNTSFLHEKRRGPRDIQIFTPEESDTLVVPMPEIKEMDLPDIPGQKYADVFTGIPFPRDNTEEEFKEIREKVKAEKKANRAIKKNREKQKKIIHSFGLSLESPSQSFAASLGHKPSSDCVPGSSVQDSLECMPGPSHREIVDCMPGPSGYIPSRQDSSEDHIYQLSSVNIDKSLKRNKAKKSPAKIQGRAVKTKKNIKKTPVKDDKRRQASKSVENRLNTTCYPKSVGPYQIKVWGNTCSKTVRNLYNKYYFSEEKIDENQVYLDKYKSVLNNKVLKVVVNRLSIDDIRGHQLKVARSALSIKKLCAGNITLLPAEQNGRVLRVFIERGNNYK